MHRLLIEKDSTRKMTQFDRTILVTGGAGFIGANSIEYFAAKYPATRIVNLDAMTYAAHPAAVEAQRRMGNVVPVRGDIADEALVGELFSAYRPQGVIHFAAESHVDNSIADPQRFVRTNVLGTGVLLNAALKYWKILGTLDASRFHHISTDEVYGSLGPEGFFTETTPYAPSSPYSASKASSDLLVLAYARTYGMNVTISRCANNYGPWQHAEKLIPTVIRSAMAHRPIPIYGTGANVRDWLWVGDHCRAVDKIFHEAPKGEIYNVGGSCERTNLEIVGGICRILDELRPWPGRSYGELVQFVADRPGHDFRYATDPSKIERALQWAPQMPFSDGLLRTVEWYLSREAAF